METVIINNTDNDKYDIKKYKARAIITDEDNYIYIMNMNNSYNFPGGTLEEGENPDLTIERELYEELGLKNIKPKPFSRFYFYHNNFPNDNGIGTHKRLNIVSIYLLTINSKDIGKSHFTAYEKKYNDKIEKYKLDELDNLIKEKNDNIWKPFTDVEIKTILKEYKKGV